MRSRKRSTYAVLVFTLAAGMMGSPRAASGGGITAFVGECIVTFHGSFDAAQARITFTTPEPGTCVTNFGGATFTLHDSFAGPRGLLPGFTCAGGVGTGGAHFTISTPMVEVSTTDARFDVVDTGSAAAISIIRDGANIHVAGSGSFEHAPSLATMCALGGTEMTWTGTFTFENLDRHFFVLFFDGHCEVDVKTVHHPASGKITLSTPVPGTCDTNWGTGQLTLEGDAGPEGTLPGFTCAGGAGSGSVSLSLVTPFLSLASEGVRLDVTEGGNVMKVVLAEHSAARDFTGAGALAGDGVAAPACESGPHRASWTGVIAFEEMRQSFGG